MTLIALSLSALLLIDGSKRASPPIGSLFYQPILTDQIDWEARFKEMRACQIDTLIIQWSRFGVVDFLKEDKWLTEILTQAKKYHIGIVVGLYGDEQYFKILESPQTNRKEYFQTLLHRQIIQAKKVYAIAKRYTIFKGWYIYDEIDDTNFNGRNRELVLKNYLQKLANRLELISPHPRYISGYFSSKMTPHAYSKMFSNITQKRYTVLLQSGIGANLVNYQKSRSYMQSFNRDFEGDYIPIVEGFKIVNSQIISSDFQSLKEQIEEVKKATQKEQVSLFSLRYFLKRELTEAYIENYLLEASSL
jgi:hypothetical protein